MTKTRFNYLLCAIIIVLLVPDSVRLLRKIKDVQKNTDSEVVGSVQNSQTKTTASSSKPSKSSRQQIAEHIYKGTEIPILLTVPKGAYQIDERLRDWEDEMRDEVGNLHAIQRSMTINELNTDQAYSFQLAASERDKQFSWEGTPDWYSASINFNENPDQLVDTFKGIGAIFVVKTHISLLKTDAYIAYTKHCYGSCLLKRIYLIPFEHEIAGRLYHTLTFVTPLMELGVTESEINDKLTLLQLNKFIKEAFGQEEQKIIETQDQIVGSVVYNW